MTTTYKRGGFPPLFEQSAIFWTRIYAARAASTNIISHVTRPVALKMATKQDKPKKTIPFLMRFQHVEGITITLTIFYLGYYHLPPVIPLPENDDFMSKLRHVIHCSVIPCFTFFYAIFAVMQKRGPKGVNNPLAGQEHLLQLEHAFAQNTLEQLIVFLLSTAIIATYLVREELKLIALNAIIFTLGRILFRIGLGIHPKYRGIGVWCGFSAQAFILGLCIYSLYTHGLMHGLEEMTNIPSLPSNSENLPKQEL